MTRHREELDEVIDRVAASMTFAPADSALAARVAGSIHTEARVAFPWFRAVVAAAAVAIVVAAIATSRNEIAERVVTNAPSDPERAAPVINPSELAPPADLPASAAPVPRGEPRAARARVAIDGGGVPQIAPLPSPDLLEVDELQTQSLTIAPVNLAPLDLSNLAIAELDSRDEYRE